MNTPNTRFNEQNADSRIEDLTRRVVALENKVRFLESLEIMNIPTDNTQGN